MDVWCAAVGFGSHHDGSDRSMMTFVYFAELFSWAEMPWSGVLDGDVMRLIQGREKLQRPVDCPNEVYESVMLKCWRLDLRTRAEADEIVSSFEAACSSFDVRELQWPASSNVQRVDLRNSGANDASTQAFDEMKAIEVPRTCVQMKQVLGSGEFGEVVLGILTINTKVSNVAVKMLKSGSGPEAAEKFKLEAQLLAGLHHPHIVEVKAVCFQSTPNFIALELMPGGDLQSFLVKHSAELKASATVQMDLLNALVQIGEAMAYLERKKVVHRDLAARFVFV